MSHMAPEASINADTAAKIAEYVCGLLDPAEHAQVHILLGRDDQALAAALAWEERLLALVDALPRVHPDPAIRSRLQQTLGIGPPPPLQPPPQLLRRPSIETPEASASQAPAAELATLAITPPTPEPGPAASVANPGVSVADPTAPGETAIHNATISRNGSDAPAERVTRNAGATQEEERLIRAGNSNHNKSVARDERKHGNGLLRQVWLWRFISLCAITAATVAFMLPGEPPPPPVQIVKVAPTRAAILQAPGSSSTPGWTATLDPHGNLMMRPLVRTEVPPGSQALLWTRSAAIPEPRLLGRIDPNRPVQVPKAQLGPLAEDQLLEITLENDQDAATGVPNGPILFIGQMAVFGAAGVAEAADPSGTAPGAAGAVVQGPR